MTDYGPPFRSNFYQELCNQLGTNCLFIATYHPRANCQAERFNHTIASELRSYVSDHPHYWCVYSDAVTFVYNSQVRAKTGLQTFDPVLFRPPPPLATDLAAPPIEDLSHQEAEFRWLYLLKIFMNTQNVVSSKARDTTSEYLMRFFDR